MAGKEVIDPQNLSPPSFIMQEETESIGLSRVTQQTWGRAGTQHVGAQRASCPTALKNNLSNTSGAVYHPWAYLRGQRVHYFLSCQG